MDLAQIILTSSFTLASMLGLMISWQFKRLIQSVEELNIKVALVIQRVETHDERIKTLERRG